MNTSSKTILASTLLVALFAGTSANAEGRAGGLNDHAEKSATQSVEIKKVSFAPTAKDYSVNR
ncbi:MAG: hypothetical protein V7749_03300 [Cocleimonas sp.]